MFYCSKLSKNWLIGQELQQRMWITWAAENSLLVISSRKICWSRLETLATNLMHRHALCLQIKLIWALIRWPWSRTTIQQESIKCLAICSTMRMQRNSHRWLIKNRTAHIKKARSETTGTTLICRCQRLSNKNEHALTNLSQTITIVKVRARRIELTGMVSQIWRSILGCRSWM